MGDRLSEIEKLINWEAFRPIFGDIYDNKTEKGGHPNIDEIIMISKKRAPGERPYAVIKNVFKSGHTMVKKLRKTGL